MEERERLPEVSGRLGRHKLSGTGGEREFYLEPVLLLGFVLSTEVLAPELHNPEALMH